MNKESILFTFTEHPRNLFSPDLNLKMITTLEEKSTMLKNLGIDEVQFREEIKRVKEQNTNFGGHSNFHDYRNAHLAYQITH